MSDRERWIVYPLLFLALGTAFRGRIPQDTTPEVLDAEIIRCSQLLVGKTVTSLPVNQIPLIPAGTISTFSDKGLLQVQIGSTPFQVRENQTVDSGIVTVHGHDGKQIIALRANYRPLIEKKLNLESATSKGTKQPVIYVQKGAYNGGGQIEVFDQANKHALVLEHHPSQLGLYATDGDRHHPLARIVKQVPRRSPKQPVKSKAAGSVPTSKKPSTPEPSKDGEPGESS